MFCKNCGNQVSESDTFCSICGTNQKPTSIEESEKMVFNTNSNEKLLGLSEYYIEEFKKIQDSKEQYKGKFNFTAFFFGVLWGLIKGLWLSAIIAIVIGILTGGIGIIVYWIVFGIRGNYIYYNYVMKDKQIPL